MVVVARSELARASGLVKPKERRPATAPAIDARVFLTRISKPASGLAVPCSMFTQCQQLEVPRVVIALHLILMVDLFALAKRSPQHLFCRQPVLVRIASYVGQVVTFADQDQHIAPRVCDATAAPIRIVRASIMLSHPSSP
jgi:hypothetical protein